MTRILVHLDEDQLTHAILDYLEGQEIVVPPGSTVRIQEGDCDVRSLVVTIERKDTDHG